MIRSILFQVAFSLSAIVAIAAGSPHKASMGFTENCGQIRTPAGAQNQSVQYLWASPAGMNVQVLNDGLAFDLWQRQVDESFKFHRLDLRFIDGTGDQQIIPLGEPLAMINDFRQAAATNISSYSQLLYSNVYPGIDVKLALTENERSFKYDFILHEGADVNDIVLEYKGFDCFSVDGDELVFEMSGRVLREAIPLSWLSENGREIQVSYKILHQTENSLLIGFEADQQWSGQPLVIDPVVQLEWSTWYGDSLYDTGNAIATDSLGNIFIAGTTESLDAIASEGSYISEYSGGETDAFLVKFNQHGLRHWATYYGGSGADMGYGVAVDQYENVYMVGATASADLLSLTEEDTVWQMSHGGEMDGFLVKFNRLGEKIWETYFGGPQSEELRNISVFENRLLVVAGRSNGASFADSLEVFGNYSGETEILLASFDNEGNFKRGGYFGGEADEIPASVIVGSSSRIILGGTTSSASGIVSADAFQPALGGATDGFVAVLDTLFSPQWSTYIGGSGIDSVAAVALDTATFSIVLTGTTDTGIEYTDTTSTQAEFGGVTDAFVAKLDSAGALNWFTYNGGPEMDLGISIDVDIDSAIYVLGFTLSDTNIVYFEEDSVYSHYKGDGDAFLTKYTPEGVREWSYYYGGGYRDYPRALSVFGRTGVFFTGQTNSTASFTVASAEESTIHQDEYGGGVADAFAARITGPKSTPAPCVCVGCDEWGGGGSGGGGTGGGGTGGGGPSPIGICLGDSIRLSTGGGCLAVGSEWVWYRDTCGGTDNYIGDGSFIYVSPTELTTYYVRAEGIDDVTSCASVTIHVDQPIEISVASPDTVCPGSYLEVSASGAETFFWNGPVGNLYEGNPLVFDTVTNLQAGMYLVQGYSTFGCTDTDTMEINLWPAPNFNVFATDPLCIGDTNGSIEVQTQDSTITSYLWQPSGLDTNMLDSLSAGDYSLLVTNSYGCSSAMELSLSEPVYPIDSLIVSADTCDRYKGSATLYLNTDPASFTIDWSSGMNQNELTAYALGDSAYTVILTDSNNCLYEEAFSVPDFGQFVASIPQDSVFLENVTTVTLEVITIPNQENAMYHWLPETGLSCPNCETTIADPLESTWYSVFVTSQYGCQASDSIFVEREKPKPNTFIPSVFSPNSDGLNDQLCVLGARILSLQLRIYGRSGQEYFHTTETDKCWNGTYNGQQVSGSVLYTFEAVLEEGMTVSESGNITIMR